MGSGGNSTAMAAYQHMPNSSGANNASVLAASAGMHAIGNSPGMLYFVSILLHFIQTRKAWQSLAYSPLGAVVLPPSEY